MNRFLYHWELKLGNNRHRWIKTSLRGKIVSMARWFKVAINFQIRKSKKVQTPKKVKDKPYKDGAASSMGTQEKIQKFKFKT